MAFLRIVLLLSLTPAVSRGARMRLSDATNSTDQSDNVHAGDSDFGQNESSAVLQAMNADVVEEKKAEATEENGVTPFMIIALGPTGSGKSGQARAMTAKLLANPALYKATAPKSLLIDDLIENDASFKKVIFDFLNAKNLRTKAAIQAYANSATQQDFAFFAKSYEDARKRSGCGGKGCSAVFRAQFAQVMKNGDNCIFESTAAGGFPGFVFSSPVMGQPYRFHAAINVLQFCELKRRNLQRFVDSAVKFMADPRNNIAPRLPDLNGLDAQIDSITNNVLAWMDSDSFRQVASFNVFVNQNQLKEFTIISNDASGRWSKVRSAVTGFDTRKKVQFKALMSSMKGRSC